MIIERFSTIALFYNIALKFLERSYFFFFFSTRPAANTTSYLYILEYTGVLMVFHRLGKPSALWTSVGHVQRRHKV